MRFANTASITTTPLITICSESITPGEDIQKLSFDDMFFNNVLKPVADDQSALVELARILITGGTAIITVHGNWRRKQTKTFSYLNYNGHYRDYGFDILDILQSSFSKVKKRNLFHYQGNRYAIKPLETAFICIK